MGFFRYKAMPQQGKRPVSGTIEAENPRHARALLREQALLPITIDRIETQSAGSSLWQSPPRIARGRMPVFVRQFSALLDAGLSVDGALQVLAEQSEDAREARLIAQLRDDIASGASLSKAFARHPATFPLVCRALIHAGEESGKLPDVMQRLATYLEGRSELNTKVGIAFVYPALVLGVSILVVIGMLAFVVPQMIQVFQGSKQELPLLTKILMGISHFANQWGGWVLLALLISGVAFYRALKNQTFLYRFHAWRLRWPIFGKLDRSANTAQFASTLSILVSSGVPLLSAMRAAEGVMSSLPLREAASKAAAQVKEGANLARSLAATKSFPPVLIHLVASGESTGRLGSMLERAANEQSKELSRKVETFTSLLGPLVVLVMGAVVLFIVLAILLPVFEMNQLVK